MSEWRELHADQNLRLAQKMLDQQAEINTLRAALAAAEARGYQRAIADLREARTGRLRNDVATAIRFRDDYDAAESAMDEILDYLTAMAGQETPA